jgi:hypothetical protein
VRVEARADAQLYRHAWQLGTMLLVQALDHRQAVRRHTRDVDARDAEAHQLPEERAPVLQRRMAKQVLHRLHHVATLDDGGGRDGVEESAHRWNLVIL